MSKTVIQVNNLSKRYRIGLKEKRHDTFVGQLGAVLKAPIDNFRRLRSMSKFGAEDESVFWALRDINFEVKEGEVLGIIGHNGAGKSTLLKILSRITEPTSGSIHIKGRIAALLEVGTGFHPDLTGRENVYMNGTILGMTKREIDAKFDEIVDFSGVEKYIDTPVKFYSSGMKVRLGFAVAAHLDPEILIIDEVLAVGDAEFQRKCLGKMEDVADSGRTVLFVSHNMALINNLCTKSILLNNGEVAEWGKTNFITQQYLKTVFEKSLENQWTYKYETPHFGLKEIEIKVNGVVTNTIFSGAKLEILLIFECHDPSIENKSFSTSILIFKDEEKITNLWTEYQELVYPIQRETHVRCTIEKWPFRMGYYRFDIYAHIKQETLEWIEQAFYLQGEEGDYFGNNVLTNSDQGNYFLNHKFD